MNSLQCKLRIDYDDIANKQYYKLSETTNSTTVYGQLVITFNLPTQWRSRGGRTLASGRINTLHSAI